MSHEILSAHVRAEEPRPPRRAPPRPRHRTATHAAGLVPCQTPEAVVAKDQADEAVVLGAADVGAVRGWRQLHDSHPPPA